MGECMVPVLIRVDLPNGFAFDIHEFRDGQVWYQRWCPGVRDQSCYDDLGRMDVEDFNEAMTKAASRV